MLYYFSFDAFIMFIQNVPCDAINVTRELKRLTFTALKYFCINNENQMVEIIINALVSSSRFI